MADTNTSNTLPADLTSTERAFAARIIDADTVKVVTTTASVFVIAVVTAAGAVVSENVLSGVTLESAQKTARSTSDILTSIGQLEGKRVKLSRREQTTRTISAFVAGERCDDEEDDEDPSEEEITTVIG